MTELQAMEVSAYPTLHKVSPADLSLAGDQIAY
jgi:hypothetical protein